LRRIRQSAHQGEETDEFGGMTSLSEVTVVSQTSDEARVVARWFTHGHAADAGYYDVFEPTAYVLVKRDDGWHVHSEENLDYE
jgi:hypothetical protein